MALTMKGAQIRSVVHKILNKSKGTAFGEEHRFVDFNLTWCLLWLAKRYISFDFLPISMIQGC